MPPHEADYSVTARLDFGPLPQKVVVHARQLNDSGVLPHILVDALDRTVEIEQQSTPSIVAPRI